jgi:hypothetical protein
MFVLALTAALTAGVAVWLTGAARQAAARDVVGRLAAFDRLAREQARRSGRATWLVFDLNEGTVRRDGGASDEGDGGDDLDAATSTLHLPAGFRVVKLVIRGGGGGGTLVSGEVPVPLSGRGQSPSYAVMVAGGNQQQWLVVAGLTGRSLSGTDGVDEAEVDQLFAALPGDERRGGDGGDAR